MIAGVETGGTKTVAAVARAVGPGQLIDELEIPTTTPAEVGERLRAFLAPHAVTHIGMAAFGPLDLDPGSPAHGSVGATPKAGWAGTRLADLVTPGASLAVVSDVTGAALGEHARGATTDAPDSAYVTVGTGVGVGALLGGVPLTGRAHPELGHVAVRRHRDDRFDGVCPFHGDCLEGLASGPALTARWGRPPRDLGGDLAAAVAIEASYLGQLLTTVTYAYRPDRVVLGGGVAKLPGLLDAVRSAAAAEVAGYLGPEHPVQRAGDYLVPPALGDRAGVVGALHLAAAQADGT